MIEQNFIQFISTIYIFGIHRTVLLSFSLNSYFLVDFEGDLAYNFINKLFFTSLQKEMCNINYSQKRYPILSIRALFDCCSHIYL